MADAPLPPAPAGTDLEQWQADGRRADIGDGSRTVVYAPSGEYALDVEADVDEAAYLVQLYELGGDDDAVIGRAATDDRRTALDISVELVKHASVLATVAAGGEAGGVPPMEEFALPDPPDEWEGDDDEWEDEVAEVVDDVDVSVPSVSTVVKEINDNQYIYLQYWDGETTRREYVCPVSPSDD